MVRPSAKVITSQEDAKGVTWELLVAEQSFIVTYKGQPVSLRTRIPCLVGYRLKYYKMTYTNLGSVKAAIRRLNKRFNTTEFSYTIMT